MEATTKATKNTSGVYFGIRVCILPAFEIFTGDTMCDHIG